MHCKDARVRHNVLKSFLNLICPSPNFHPEKLRALNNVNPWTIEDTLPPFAQPNAPLRNMGNPHQPGFNPSLPYANDNRGSRKFYLSMSVPPPRYVAAIKTIIAPTSIAVF
jgi:hypothetical protein